MVRLVKFRHAFFSFFSQFSWRKEMGFKTPAEGPPSQDSDCCAGPSTGGGHVSTDCIWWRNQGSCKKCSCFIKLGFWMSPATRVSPWLHVAPEIEAGDIFLFLRIEIRKGNRKIFLSMAGSTTNKNLESLSSHDYFREWAPEKLCATKTLWYDVGFKTGTSIGGWEPTGRTVANP